MRKLKGLNGKKYIALILTVITLCCITIFANDKAVTTAEQKESQMQQQSETIDSLLQEIAALKDEVATMKQNLSDMETAMQHTYVAQKDVNAFEETSSYSKLNGTFKAGSVIRINNISEDNVWAETDQGYVKLIFLTQLNTAKQETLFVQNTVVEEKPVVQEPIKTEYRIGVTGKSGLTKEDLDYLLAGSKMANCADEVLYIEDKHNVNAFFTISVAQAETQRGLTGTGKSKNNAYGIINARSGGYRYFSSLADSVIEFGGMMERMYISKGRDTVSKVHSIYTDSPNWATNVETIMKQELAKIKQK